MPRRCEICASTSLKDINVLLLDNQSYEKISKDYEFSAYQIRSHFINHVQPVMQGATEKAQEAIIETATLHADTLLAPLQKVLKVQSDILNDLEEIDSPKDRLSLRKSLIASIQEELKIGGHYTQDRTNPKDVSLEEAVRAKAAENGEDPAVTLKRLLGAIETDIAAKLPEGTIDATGSRECAS